MTTETRNDDRPNTIWPYLLAWALLGPILLAWTVAPTVAVRPKVWGRRSWVSRHPILTTGMALAVTGIVIDYGIQRYPDTVPQWVIPLIVWAVQIPIALACLRARLCNLAGSLVRGELQPNAAGRIRDAIWDSGVREAFLSAGWIAPVQGGKPAPLRDKSLEDNLLGVIIDSDKRSAMRRRMAPRPEYATASSWMRNGRLVLPHDPFRLICLGGSGTGKTILLTRICSVALRRGWRVMFIDGKGIKDDQRTFVHIAYAAGIPESAVTVWPQMPIDLWRGTATELVKKAIGLLPPVSGPSAFYRQQTEGVLYALAKSPKGPWRSSDELLRRLKSPREWLRSSGELAMCTVKQHGEPLHMRIYSEMAIALEPLAGGEAATGWSWDDPWELAVMSINAGENSGSTAIASAMLTDLDGYRYRRRKTDDRPLIVIIDEVGTITSGVAQAPLSRMLESVRSQDISMILSGQSSESLGVEADRLLNSGVTIAAARTSFPDPLINRMGTIRAQELGHQVDTTYGARSLGVAAAREQHRYVADPSVFRTLPGWCWIISDNGKRIDAVIPPLSQK